MHPVIHKEILYLSIFRSYLIKKNYHKFYHIHHFIKIYINKTCQIKVNDPVFNYKLGNITCSDVLFTLLFLIFFVIKTGNNQLKKLKAINKSQYLYYISKFRNSNLLLKKIYSGKKIVSSLST